MRVSDLIASYRTDPASAYHAKRFRSREHFEPFIAQFRDAMAELNRRQSAPTARQ